MKHIERKLMDLYSGQFVAGKLILKVNDKPVIAGFKKHGTFTLNHVGEELAKSIPQRGRPPAKAALKAPKVAADAEDNSK